MDLQLRGKKAIVTGGSRGIGRATALSLAREGVDVAIAARDRARVEAAAAEIAAETGRTIVPLMFDGGDTASVDAMVAAAAEQLGGVDILVNNAARPGGGAGSTPGIEGFPDALFNDEMNTKVLGYLRAARAVTPHMKRAGWGRIINISGLAARQSGNAIGSMRNVAVSALTKNLADELGPSGINVTVVHPGGTWTERMPALIAERARERGITEEEARSQLLGQNSVQLIIDATDIANIVTFLASPLSVAITGDAIAAGGGVGRAIHY